MCFRNLENMGNILTLCCYFLLGPQVRRVLDPSKHNFYNLVPSKQIAYTSGFHKYNLDEMIAINIRPLRKGPISQLSQAEDLYCCGSGYCPILLNQVNLNFKLPTETELGKTIIPRVATCISVQCVLCSLTAVLVYSLHRSVSNYLIKTKVKTASPLAQWS